VAAQVGNSYMLTCAVPLLASMVTGLPLCILGCIACSDRQELIRRHNLPPEDPFCSCLTLSFCACCAVIQELNELEAYGRAQAQHANKHVIIVPAGGAAPPPQPQQVMMAAPTPAAATPVAAPLPQQAEPSAPGTTATV
jgi:Cys-rich protein (TIGR01571 family)